MRNGAILSGLLHGSIILLLLIGLPDFFRRDLVPPPVVPIEIVNIADITQAPAPKVQPKDETPVQEVKEEKPVPPKPVPVIEEVIEPEPETPEPEPEPKPEPVVEKSPEPELTIDDLLAPLPEEKKEEKKKETPPKKKEKKKDKKKKEKKKKKKQDFMSILNNIDKTEASSEGKAQAEQDVDSTADHAANNISNVLSITELDLIRRQLEACWNIPAGARDAKDLYVDVRIEMNPDATVASAVVTGSGGGGSFAKAASDSALRAVRNPSCSPLKLPLDRYDQWKTITIRFDPKNIL
jgi:outer membrane biosynthesis protein TonB